MCVNVYNLHQNMSKLLKIYVMSKIMINVLFSAVSIRAAFVGNSA